MQRMKLGFIIVLIFILSVPGFSQKDSASGRFHIAIFAPLYLDSAFDVTESYRYGTSFPRLFNAGLEFYEGTQLAIDSLQREGAMLVVHVYDTKGAKPSFEELVKSDSMDKMDLIIGHVSAHETRLLADSAAKKNIPFINVNFPNDAGVTNNPNFVLLNSTLKTHCEGLYRFLQKNFALSPIILFRKRVSRKRLCWGILRKLKKIPHLFR